MVGSVEPRRNQCSVDRFLTRCNSRRSNDPCQLDLKLDCPILVEIPVVSILIVAYRRDRRDYESAGAPDLHPCRAILVVFEMFPEQGIVLLVHADGILQGS